MKNVLLTAALLSSTVFMVPAAHATFDLGDIMDFMSGCETLCDPGRADFKQDLYGFQWSMNQIVDIDDATDIVQSAVNAGNLVTVRLDDEDGNVEASLNLALGTVIQTANVHQKASNLIDGRANSDFYALSQAATNVVNSITGTTAWNISQSVTNAQLASNAMYGGSGGYDADAVDWDADDVEYTQAAVNASNLVDIQTLKNDIVQVSTASQTATNVASFESEIGFSHHYPFFTVTTPNVYDLGQSATNVTNSVTVGAIELGGLYGGCACGFEVDQYAVAAQTATNYLSTMGDVTNIAQKATNVANSISIPSVD